MDWIVFSAYRFLLLPIFFILVRFISIFNFGNKFFETLHFRLKNQFHFRPTFDPKKKSIGVHAASGEIEYAFPLIRRIKEIYPQYNVVVTLSSTSVLKSVMNNADVDSVGPAPLDLFWRVSNFLKTWDFRMFLFARTDVWPELSFQLNSNGIPSYLFSATFSKYSSNKWPVASSLSRWSFNHLSHIFAVSEEDKKNIESIDVQTKIAVTGDTRYDQVFYKKALTKADLPNIATDKKVFVAGSTWPEDEAVLFPALIKASRQWSAIIAPHEVNDETLLRIESFFESQQLKTIRLSKITEPLAVDSWDILIVDRYGYLFHLYKYADLAFVGGSFKSKVHSVMEPMSHFKPVCVGPFHQNNREAIEFSKIPVADISVSIVQSVKNENELADLLALFGKMDTIERDKILNFLKQEMLSHQGATGKTFEAIRNSFK